MGGEKDARSGYTLTGTHTNTYTHTHKRPRPTVDVERVVPVVINASEV